MTMQIELAPEMWNGGVLISTQDTIAISNKEPGDDAPKAALYISDGEDGIQILVNPAVGFVRSCHRYRVDWEHGRLEEIKRACKPDNLALFLFIGGEQHGEFIEVSVDLLAETKDKAGGYQETYVKRQVVHPDKPGRSMPVFVEVSILENDNWLKDLAPSILDALWLKDDDGNPVGHEPLEDAEEPHPHLCFEHGGSLACEEHNEKHGFQCPRCAEGRD